jgi:hypothetical protein
VDTNDIRDCICAIRRGERGFDRGFLTGAAAVYLAA